MARDFSNPKKLGFMRFLQVIFSINILLTLALSVFLIKEHYTLDFVDVLDYLNLIFEAMSFWLIWQRKRAARSLIMAFSLFNIVIGVGYNLGQGDFSPLDQLLDSWFDIILFLYFLTSRRVKAVLPESFTAEVKREELEREISYYQPRTWAFWRNLIMYFCVFSVVGHWMEAAYCTLIRFGLLPGIYDPNSQIWSDWLYPFPVYGVGAVACVLLLYPIKNFLEKHIGSRVVPLLISFVVNALVCTLIELAMGLALNMDYALWDYRDMFGNFMGQVCLQNAVAFGIAATLMTWVIYPAAESGLRKLSKDVVNTAFAGVCVGFAILVFLYFINVALPGVSVTSDGADTTIEIDVGEMMGGAEDGSAAAEGGGLAVAESAGGVCVAEGSTAAAPAEGASAGAGLAGRDEVALASAEFAGQGAFAGEGASAGFAGQDGAVGAGFAGRAAGALSDLSERRAFVSPAFELSCVA